MFIYLSLCMLLLWFRLQYTEESIGQAEKTELEPSVEQLVALVDATKTCTDNIISQTEALLQPNPGERDRDIMGLIILIIHKIYKYQIPHELNLSVCYSTQKILFQ